jgi:tetratricopeptide (TPR) repeat protein
MRVTVQLIYASDGSHRWSRTYDRQPSNILEVQDEIAQTVAQELRVVLGRAPAKTEGGSNFSDAYNQILKGNFLFARFTREDTEGAIKAFQRAIQIDPTYAMGWARLSLAERRMAVQAWAPPAEAEARARRAVERALKIEPNLSMGLIAMHQIHLDFDWDWSAARKDIDRVREIDPMNTKLPELVAGMAENFGHYDEATRLRQEVVNRDPLNAGALNNLAGSLGLAGRFEEAILAYRALLEIDSTYAAGHTWLGVTLAALGRNAEALAEVEKESDPKEKLWGSAVAYWALGRKAESDAALRAFVQRYRSEDPYTIAQIHTYRGEMDEAFTWLDRSLRQRQSYMTSIGADAILQKLRPDPRFQALLVKMKLTE